MPFQIGEVYRYSSRDRGEGVPAKIVDGLPNFFYETYGGEDKSSIFFQKGIHNIASVDLSDGSKRIPAIIISSSPHKAGSDITPWEDEFDPDHGRIRYYGDGKPEYESADNAPGNALLRKTFLSIMHKPWAHPGWKQRSGFRLPGLPGTAHTSSAPPSPHSPR